MKKPTRRTVHIGWLAAAAMLAAMLARGAVPAVFLGVFVVVWLLGFVVVEKIYRRRTAAGRRSGEEDEKSGKSRTAGNEW